MHKKKVALISLGCAKNLVDSENILGLLKDVDDYQITTSINKANLIVINTCGFISSSKKESIDTILKYINLGKKVLVTGCLVERYEKELRKEIPEVDQYISISNYKDFNKLLKIIDPNINNITQGVSDKNRVISTGNFSAYLKIGEGCDNRCSYCAIPLIRGGFVSRKQEDIILEAKKLASLGYKELIILQQDTTKYGIDLKNGTNIVSLLKEILKIKSLDYIRLLYLYPDEISDELIKLIKDNSSRLAPYFDIPIQHSEDTILKAMNRRGDKVFLTNLFKKIRLLIPNAILRTTVMVGFPGETRKDFLNLKKFIEEIGFDHLGVFAYSKEEGTASFTFPKQVNEKTKNNRKEEIMELQQAISYRLNKKHIGEVMQGLVIGKNKDDEYLLRSYFNAPDDIDGKIYFYSEIPLQIGDKVNVKITHAFVYDLYGEFINK